MSQNFPKHGGNVYSEAYRLGLNINKILDASASIVPFKPPLELYLCLLQSIFDKSIKIYPDRSHKDLKEAIANLHNVSPEMVLPGNGAAELFTWAAKDASEIGISGLPDPGFSDYKRAISCWGGDYLSLPLPLKWPSQSPQKFPIKSETEIIWITNPHNPTGQLWSKDSLETLLKKHKLVICDEAFLPIVPNGEDQSLIPLVNKYPNLIVIRSLTKLFSVPGLRLGYAISSKERINHWQDIRDPWPINALATAFGLRIIKNSKALNKRTKKVHEWISKEGPWVYRQLKKLKTVTVHHSSSNFILIESNSSMSDIIYHLSKKGILIRDCRSFDRLGENFLRLSIQNRRQNKYIIKCIQEIL